MIESERLFRLKTIRQILFEFGWKIISFNEILDKAIYTKKEGLFIFIPSSEYENIKDYNIRIMQIIEVLANINNYSKDKLIKEIKKRELKFKEKTKGKIFIKDKEIRESIEKIYNLNGIHKIDKNTKIKVKLSKLDKNTIIVEI